MLIIIINRVNNKISYIYIILYNLNKIMRLPKIQEDQSPLKSDYYESIIAKHSKKYKADKLIIDWLSAQIDLIKKVPDDDDILQKLIDLQKMFKEQEVPRFYSFFFVAKIINILGSSYNPFDSSQKGTVNQKKAEVIKKINQCILQLSQKKSDWHQIKSLILLRETSLQKIKQNILQPKKQSIHNLLDDSRFINFEIIKKIKIWRKANVVQGQMQPIFMYEDRNYLIKMINDNTDAINTLNTQSLKFMTPPNPFFLSRDGNKSNMPQTQQSQIEECMEFLAKQKASQLRLVMDPPKYVEKAQGEGSELKTLRYHLQSEKNQQIMNVYKTKGNFNHSSINLNYKKQDKRVIEESPNSLAYRTSSLQRNKNHNIKNINANQNKLQKMINNKEIETLKNLENSKKNTKYQSKNKYQGKINELKRKIEDKEKQREQDKTNKIQIVNDDAAKQRASNLMRISTLSMKSSNNKLPKTVSEIKAPKPKIKLVLQKQTNVEQTVKALLPAKNLQAYNSLQVRKTTQSFFKTTEKNQRNEKEIDLKPVTHYSRSLSALNKLSISNLSVSKKKKKNLSIQKKDKSLQEQQSLQKTARQDMIMSAYHKKPVNKISSLNDTKMRKKNKSNFEEEKSNLSTSKHDIVDEELRMVKNRLKDLTIFKIYGNKQKLKNTSPQKAELTNSNIKYQEQIFPTKKSIQKSRRLQEDQLLQKKKLLKTAKQKDIKKLETNNQDYKKKEEELKKQNIKHQEELINKLKIKNKIQEQMKEKDKRIEQLLKKLEGEQKEDKKTQQNQNEQTKKLQKIKSQKLKEIQEIRRKISVENLLLKQKMEEEQKKFIKLKEEQFKLKEQQINNKFKQQIDGLKEEFIKKNNQMEKKILEEEKIRKENEIKIMEEQKKMREMEMMLEQKKIKEQLLAEILKEQQQKQKKEEENMKETQIENINRLKKQIIYREELQRAALQNYEEENRKINEMFEALKRRNQEFEQNNKEKLNQIKKLQEEAREEQEAQKKIEQQIKKIEKGIPQLQQSQKISDANNEQDKNQALNAEKEEQEDIESIKQRVKEEILRDMLAQKQKQKQLIKQEEDERARRIMEIQQQIRQQLKRQEQQMQKLEKQENQRYQAMKKQIQEEYVRKKQERQKIIEDQLQKEIHNEQEDKKQRQDNQSGPEKREKQSNQKNIQLQNNGIQAEQIKQIYQKQQEKNKNINVDIRNEQRIQNAEKDENNKDQKNYNKVQNYQKKEIRNIQVKQIKLEKQVKQNKHRKQTSQMKQEKPNQKLQGQQEKFEKDDKQKNQKLTKEKQRFDKGIVENNEQVKKATQKDKQEQREKQSGKGQDKKQNIQNAFQKIQDAKQNKQDTKQKKQDEIWKNQNTKKIQQENKQENKQLHRVKQSTEDILDKYQNLQQYLVKSKQLTFQDWQIPEYLNNFFNSMAPQVKQMMPYSKKQLQAIMTNSNSNKKIDIFDTKTIGWIDSEPINTLNQKEPKERYILIGQIGCIQSIVKKYGAVQIQIIYFFQKTNPYQKKFLAKQIKIYEKIGYIFQKKLKEDNMYSIKLIIKIPVEVVVKNFRAPSRLFIAQNKLVMENNNKNNGSSFQFCTSYLLSQILKNCLGAKQQLQFRESKNPEDVIVKNKTHLKYYNDNNFRTNQIDDNKIQTQVTLNLRYLQTQNVNCFALKGTQYSSSNGQKLFIHRATQTLSCIVFSSESKQFSLNTVLDIKTQHIESQLQILICIPIWKKNQIQKLSKPGPRDYSFSHNVPGKMLFGSIVTTTIQKQQFILISPPFVFAIYQTNTQGLLLRPIYGQVVNKEDVIFMKS